MQPASEWQRRETARLLLSCTLVARRCGMPVADSELSQGHCVTVTNPVDIREVTHETNDSHRSRMR
jgi:hypothetical protein